MQRSDIDNMTCSFYKNGDSDDEWPELDQKNQAKHPARKKELNLRENDGITTLDDLEYPELGETSGKSRNSIVSKKDRLPNPDINMEENMESKQPKSLRRYRRTDKICINLREALENIRCMNRLSNEELSRLKTNLCKGNLGITAPGITDRNKDSDFRKVRTCISKAKKSSWMERIIMRNRYIKARIRKNVNTINFNALKIATDPEADPIKEEIKQEISSVKTEHTNIVNYSRSFREYCTNMLTKSLNKSLEQFLGEINRLQRRFHEKNPNKSKYKRRYYAGMKEVCKQIELKKIKFVIIAPDHEKIDLEGGLDDQVDKLLDTCKKQNVVYCFGLKRRKLGYYIYGRGLVGCIGIANYGGTEMLFKSVLTELLEARNAFKQLSGTPEAAIDVSKVLPEDYLPSESVATLLKALSPFSMCS